MGLVLSIWRRFRQKTTTKEVLESIEKDINDLESTLHRNRELQRRMALSLILISMGIYFFAAIVFYIWFLPENWSDRLVWTLPFLCFPFIITLLKRLLHFIFVTRINKQAKKLEDLNKQKRKILEEVMDNETYKVAKELLTKYDPHGKLVQRESEIKTPTPPNRQQSPGQELRQRPNAARPGSAMAPLPIQGGSPANNSERKRPPLVHQSQSVSLPPAREQPRIGNGQPIPSMPRTNLMETMSISTPNLTCPILPRERSFFDKVAEYFIGDGPGYRYALICKQCFSHNGMALEDEFDYMAFRCCYCGMFNPSRKKRPHAPSLDDLQRQDSEGSSTATPDSVIPTTPKVASLGSSQDIESQEDQDGEEEEDSGSEKGSGNDERNAEPAEENVEAKAD